MASSLSQVLLLVTLLASTALGAKHTSYLQHSSTASRRSSALHKSLASLLGAKGEKEEAKGETSSNAEAQTPAADDSSSGGSSSSSSDGGDSGGSVTTIGLDSEKQVSTLQEGATVYSQLDQVSQEFAQIRVDDEQHVHKLLLNVNLRDQLRERLMKASETLRADDDLLTSQVAAVKEAHQGGSNATTPSAPLGLISLNQAVMTSAGFLARQAGGQNLTAEEDLAKSALATLDTLDQQIANVRAKDKAEVQALQANAKNRDMLKGVIKKQQDQLFSDTSVLEGNLDQIKELAAPPAVATAAPVVAAAAVDPAPVEQQAAPISVGGTNDGRQSAMEEPSDPGYD